jgi:hypothetical protein
MCCTFFNRHYNPGWVSACSTVVEHSKQEGFTECRCQRHVKPPTWRRNRDLERSNFRDKRPPASEATLANTAAEGGNMGEKWPRILPKVATSTSLLSSFTCRKARHGTDGFTPLQRKACWGFFRPKNPTASACFEPADWGTKGQHATCMTVLCIFFILCFSLYAAQRGCFTWKSRHVVIVYSSYQAKI